MHAPRNGSVIIMNRRGFSLLELLIALTLLVALGAIAFPVVMRYLDEQAFETGADVTMNHLLLARAHAEASAQPVEVRYLPSPPRLESRLFLAGRTALQGGEYRAAQRDSIASSGEDDGGALALDFGDEAETDETVIAAGWSLQVLPEELRLSRTLPLDAEDPDEAMLALMERSAAPIDPFSPGDDERPIRMAVFLPDGSAMLASAVWLFDGSGRSGRITVNPFTGLPTFERASDLPSALPEETEDQEEPEEDAPLEEDFPDELPPDDPGDSAPDAGPPDAGEEGP